MASVLVTGGAGYIGSHMVQALRRAGYRTVVLDNLSEGHEAAVQHGDLIREDLENRAVLRAIFRRHRPSAVFHFAASARVEESMTNPIAYYKNNVAGTLNLLESALEAGVPRIILSSTAAVYGEPVHTPITEDHPLSPINPYGWSKMMAERMLMSLAESYGLHYVVFRYFNAAGADVQAKLGEDHRPETHLIPLALKAARFQEEELKVYGNDYPTPDGTCIRDYVHVLDLVEAHLMGLEHLEQGGENLVLNLGTETGTSVMEVMNMVRDVTGVDVPHRIEPRRPGDPVVLVASGAKAREVLGWKPKRDLEEIVRSANDFLRVRPEGYPDPPGPLDDFPMPQPQRAEAD